MRKRLLNWRALLTLGLILAACVTDVSVIAAQRRSKKRQPGTRYKFSAGLSARNIKLELINNLPVVQARVNNSDPLWFIFDTGATNTVIDTNRAGLLGLKAKGKIVSTGPAAPSNFPAEQVAERSFRS